MVKVRRSWGLTPTLRSHRQLLSLGSPWLHLPPWEADHTRLLALELALCHCVVPTSCWGPVAQAMSVCHRVHLPGAGLVCQAEAQLVGMKVIGGAHVESGVLLLLGPASGDGSGDTPEGPVSQPLATWWQSACNGDAYLWKKGAVQMLMLGAISHTYRSLIKHTHKIVTSRSFI